jgi:hypothetical protein
MTLILLLKTSSISLQAGIIHVFTQLLTHYAFIVFINEKIKPLPYVFQCIFLFSKWKIII